MNRDSRRSRVTLGVLILLTLVLLVVDASSGPGGPTDRLRGTFAAVLGPAERLTGGIGRPIGDAFAGLRGDQRRQIERLQRDNDALRLQARADQDTRRRAAELDGLLKTAGLGQYRIVPARVLAVGPREQRRWVATLDAGSQDGIKAEMTVLSGQGLVGRVLTVGPTTSDVLLVTDPEFAVGVRLEGTGRIGIASGKGQDPMSLSLLDANTPVGKGSRLVTLGSVGNRPFVPGVPVGEVQSVGTQPGTLSRGGTVLPYVDVTSLDLVGVVVQPPRTDPRDAVLPPRPPGAAR